MLDVHLWWAYQNTMPVSIFYNNSPKYKQRLYIFPSSTQDDILCQIKPIKSQMYKSYSRQTMDTVYMIALLCIPVHTCINKSWPYVSLRGSAWLLSVNLQMLCRLTASQVQEIKTLPHTHTSAFALLFDQCQLVSISISALEKEWGATALEFPMWDDGNAISQKVCFIHVVGRQQNCAA